MEKNKIRKNGTDEPICRAEVETQTQRTDLRTQPGKERVGQMRVALNFVCEIDIVGSSQGAQPGAL